MKKLIFIITIIISINIFSQVYVGGRLALNMSTSSVMPELVDYSKVSQFVPKLGANGGLVLKYRFIDALAVKTEFLYSGKGLKADIDEVYNDTSLTGEWNYTFGYFEIPLMFEYLFGGSRTGPFVEFGGYYGYMLFAHYSEYAKYGDLELLNNDFDLETDFDGENDNTRANRNEFGFKAGLGFNFEVGDNIINVTLRYSQGLTDIIDYRKKPDNYEKTYNRTFQIGVAYLFELGSGEDKIYEY